MIEPILLTAVSVFTYLDQQQLTNATGFFFERDERLFLVTSRHVVIDEASQHRPDRLVLELHNNPDNMAESTGFSIPLYHEGKALWRQGVDGGGEVDVAVIEIDREALPEPLAYRAFSPRHVLKSFDKVEVGTRLLLVGFPLGFKDSLHHLPVVRQAAIASSFGLRFQGQGYFLTDGRAHRGSSGAPVVMRAAGRTRELGDLDWMLLGIHSARLDSGSRDQQADEALGLNCAWYADILLTLTED